MASNGAGPRLRRLPPAGVADGVVVLQVAVMGSGVALEVSAQELN